MPQRPARTTVMQYLALLLVIVTFPLTLGISLCVALFSGLPVLFCQKRVGQGGRVFTVYKFRTMVRDAEKKQVLYRGRNEADGPVFKIHDDPRFTGVGKFLAHTGLDELPQLINVIRGEMALIGPRPLPVSEEKKLKPWQRVRETVKPGIISPWILEGYHKQTFDAWMKSDIAYIKHKNFYYDVTLAGKTIGFLIQLFFREILPS